MDDTSKGGPIYQAVYDRLESDKTSRNRMHLMFQARAQLGLDRYGAPFETELYSIRGWVDQALEEAIDQVVYLMALKMKLEGVKNGIDLTDG